MLFDADVGTRDGLGRVIAASRAWPLSHVAYIQRSATLAGGYHAAMSGGPGWLAVVAGEHDLGSLHERPFLERPGLGLHHLGARWPSAHASAAQALGLLLAEPVIGPTLSGSAKHLGWNPTSLGRTIRRECGLPYPAVRVRRGLLLMAGLIACEGRSFAAAAESLEWDRGVALRAFRAHGVEWRRFEGPEGRGRIVKELHGPLLSSPFVSKRDRSVTDDD